MRPGPARVLFGLVAAIALVLGVFTGKPIFFVVAAGTLALLASSFSASRVPLTRGLAGFRGQTVDVLLWGARPPQAPADLVLASVNIIGLGVHVFFRAPSGPVLHLKVAQPKGSIVTRGRVIIRAAKYVQWNVTRVEPVAGASAVGIALRGKPESEGPGSMGRLD